MKSGKMRLAGVALSLALSMSTSAQAQGDAGSYLAGQIAFAQNDFDDAARYFTRALARDTTNTNIMEDGTLAYVAAGNVDRAITLARRLHDRLPENQLAALLMLADAVKKGEFARATDLLENTLNLPLLTDVSQAWVLAGAGNMSGALAKFSELADDQSFAPFALFHQAAALAWVGDMESALEILERSDDNGFAVTRTKATTVLHAQILAQIDRGTEALDFVDAYLMTDADPAVIDLRTRLATGQEVGFDAITQAADGVAEVLVGVASVVMSDQDVLLPLTYARIAEYLRPDHVDATLFSASLLERLGQYDIATEAYDRIANDDPAYFDAELGRANALGRSGDAEGAIAALQTLVSEFPDLADGHSLLGDMLRREERFAEATLAYDRAIELMAASGVEDWFLYYVRGITHEREDRWDMAEADFRKALELEPDQPSVLNYLGYSFVEMQINLDEALQMIRTAVDRRPRDGYITDSLGWVYYRLGRYEEAVEWMERAASLMATDPIVNDHLGDTYWAVGREREARFQWMRAMSFEPEEEDAERIRRKLEVGLDVVLEEEGAPPLHAE